jgi:hypothetical protein
MRGAKRPACRPAAAASGNTGDAKTGVRLRSESGQYRNKKCGVTIGGPERFAENARWADVVFATGSTVVNGTIDAIVKDRPDTVFYGVTIAGIARLAGLRQFCHITGATHA